LLDLGRVTPAYAYARAQEVRAAATRMLTAMLDDVDAMLLPVVSEPPPDIATTGDARFQIPWTLCGFPCVAVPSGMVKGLPVAVQLVGAPTRESRLLTAAAWCEHVFDVNLRPPEP
jgi:Asp-tRNA(Asn)/Glu-tRNA(Gln) amidotransferase A subunit family amidase